MHTNGTLSLNELTGPELQQVVLMVKSKRQFALFLGINNKEASFLWDKHELMNPIKYLRSMVGPSELADTILVKGYKEAAEHFGVSANTLKQDLMHTNGTLSLNELTGPELQQVVLMVKSKRQFALFLGINNKEASFLWDKHELMNPIKYLRSMVGPSELADTILVKGYKEAAEHFGVSANTLKQETMVRLDLRLAKAVSYEEVEKTGALSEEVLRRYGSVKLTARMTGLTESEIRRWADDRCLNLAPILRWDEADNSQGKGRRAELAAMAWRGKNVEFDANIKLGVNAPYDFQDKKFGRVNVKSSLAHPYGEQSKRNGGDKWYWKFGTKGLAKCDTVLCVCYDSKGEKVLHYLRLYPKACLQQVDSKAPKSFRLTQTQVQSLSMF